MAEQPKRKKVKVENKEVVPQPPPPIKNEDPNDSDSSLERKIEEHKLVVPSTCPFLDTIHRNLLDFDFEKVCSVSLSNLNVYACLVCGKYFQGRGLASHAYNHSIHDHHHVFINLNSKKIYCLPDNYEVEDPSLDDIKYLLDPLFTVEMVASLDTKLTSFRALDGHDYVPGVIGVNNLKQTGYVSAVLHAIVHVPLIRNFFLIQQNYKNCRSPLVRTFGEFVRKIWNPVNFKGHVSPHELMQAVTLLSRRKFQIGTSADALDFFLWLLNTLHVALGGTKKRKSVIHQAFQGELKVFTDKLEKHVDSHHATTEIRVADTTTTSSPFLFLSMDLPSMPIFKDIQERNIIPQVAIYGILSKFDGRTPTAGKEEQKRFVLQRLPPYLTLVFRRFHKNNFFKEKNKTIVTFPVKNLDLRDYVTEEVKKSGVSTKYDLLASIRHDGDKVSTDSYVVNCQNKASGIWYQIQDLEVEETAAQLMSVAEAYIQIYEQQQPKPQKQQDKPQEQEQQQEQQQTAPATSSSS